MTQKIPSLELVSGRPETPNESLDRAERRRVPRLNLTSEQFRLQPNGKVFCVTDVSRGGMALRVLDLQDLTFFPVGTQLEGVLNLRGVKLAIRAQVRHLGAEIVGCQFSAPSPELQKALEVFLDPVALGADLKAMPHTEGGTIWYHGPTGTDLLLKRGVDGQYFRITLLVQSSYIQWDEESGLSTGRAEVAREAGETRGVIRFETLLLHPDTPLDEGKLSVAKTLVSSSNLSQDLKRWCLRHLEVRRPS